jgi:hypothetical protein
MGWRSLPGLEVYHNANVEYCAEPVRNIRLKFDDFISKLKKRHQISCLPNPSKPDGFDFL